MKFLPVLPILTRYPLLKISAVFLKEIGVNTSSELKINFKKFPEVVDLARKIVFAGIEGKNYQRRVDESDIICTECENRTCSSCREIGDFSKCNLCLECFINCNYDYPLSTYRELQTMAKLAVLTYMASRIIVSGLEDWVRMRYAVSEADYYSRLLQDESDAVIRIVAKDLGVILNGWKVHVTSYVATSSRLRAEGWRLVNRRLTAGYVDTNRKEVMRIIEEFMRARLYEQPVFDLSEFEETFGDILREAKGKAMRESKFEADLGEVDVKCFPPCMKEILAELQRGMNVPHTARFAITSFLINIGMDVDGIIELFNSAPDFDEEKTRYQVEHIAGERGKGVEYISPSCDTMRTYNNCIAKCDVKHPLIFYTKCKSKKREGKKD